ncbi:MAG: selenide, water dikinase SelD [Bacillota bacterium]
MPRPVPRLTSLSSCAGCAAKLGQVLLRELLHGLPHHEDGNVLVAESTGDDAGIYRLRPDCALVQTVDFFTPIVDDPFDYGQIAAANAVSDVYAMGGRPLTAMNLVGMPTDRLPSSVIRRILRGGAAKLAEARCALVGGHTIRCPEPIYGISVTGTVHPRRITPNAAARPGDLLLLTKPLGTGIVTTALKRGLAPPRLARLAIASMKRLNVAGAELAERGLVRAATDITGFGLMGHLASLCRASHVSAEIDAAAVPIFSPQVLELVATGCVPGGSRTNRTAAEAIARWKKVDDVLRTVLTDAQTSGGLLLAVSPRKLDAVRHVLRLSPTPTAAVIGRVVSSRHSHIVVHQGAGFP